MVPASLTLQSCTTGVRLHRLAGLYQGTGVHVVLGLDWLAQHDATIHVGQQRIELTARGKRHVISLRDTITRAPSLHTYLASLIPNTPELTIISAQSAKRAIRKGCYAELMRITTKPVPLASLAPGPIPDVKAGVLDPGRLHAVLEKFPKLFQALTGLPPERPISHLIRLKPGAQPTYRRPWRYSAEERAVISQTVQELLEKGWIEEAASPWGANVLLIQKRDGGLRMCVDYRALNAQTIRDGHPIPLVSDLLDRIGRNRVVSSVDMLSAYHQVLIPEEDRPKTAFVTPDGQYQYKVMPFGLTNAPATFQRLMNSIFARDKLLYKYVLVYLDDILIMSPDVESHYY